MSILNNLETLRRVERKLDALLRRNTDKVAYTTDEFAAMVDRSTYTVREWCKTGQIRAARSMTRAGPTLRWVISNEEYIRYKREGLLPVHRIAG
jgi:hypothetical protein